MLLQYENNRIWSESKDKTVIAEVLFPLESENVVNITHTFVDDSLRGQGAAGKLMEAAAEKIRQNNWQAKLTCSYAIAWFSRHKEYEDILFNG